MLLIYSSACSSKPLNDAAATKLTAKAARLPTPSSVACQSALASRDGGTLKPVAFEGGTICEAWGADSKGIGDHPSAKGRQGIFVILDEQKSVVVELELEDWQVEDDDISGAQSVDYKFISLGDRRAMQIKHTTSLQGEGDTSSQISKL